MKVRFSAAGEKIRPWLSFSRAGAGFRMVLALMLVCCVLFLGIDGATVAYAAEDPGSEQTDVGQTDVGQTGGGQTGGEQAGGQTGSGQTGQGQTGEGQTDVGQTGGEQTDVGQTGGEQTDVGQTGGGQTDVGQTGGGQTDVGQTGGGQTGGGQTGSGQTDEGQTGSGQTGEGQAGEGQTGSGQTGEGQTGEGQTGEGQTGGGQTGEGQTGEGQTGEGQTGEGQTGEGQTGGGQTGEGQTGEGQTGGGQTGEGQTGEGQTGEGQTGGTEVTAESKALGSANAATLAAANDDSTQETPVGQDDAIEAYAIPAGSAYIYEIGSDIQYENDAQSNAITKAVTDALTYIKGLYEEEGAEGSEGDGQSQVKEATIVVSDGVYQGSVDISSSGGGDSLIAQLISAILGLNEENPSQLRLNIVAEDSFTEEEDGSLTFHSNGAGGAQVEGNINVDMGGVHVLLGGLLMSTQGQITVTGADGVTYYGTAQDDVINLDVSNLSGTVKVDSGSGDDRVSVRVKKKQNFNIAIEIDSAYQSEFEGFSAETTLDQLPDALKTIMQDVLNQITGLDLEASETHVDVGIDLGQGNDVLDFTLVDSTDLKLGMITGDTSGEAGQLLKYGFGIDTGAADVAINGQEGNDRITVSGARSFTMGQSVVQFLTDSIQGTTAFDVTQFTLDGGDGDDVLTVDTTAPFSTIGGIQTSITGSEGFDRLHITGKLNKNLDESRRISVSGISDALKITIAALAELTFLGSIADDILTLTFTKQFEILSNGIDAFTDELENKRTIELTGDALTGEALPYTDYIITDYQTDDDGVAHVDFTSQLSLPQNELFFTNVIAAPESGNTLQIDRLIADGLNVRIAAKHILVDGHVSGSNVLIYAVGSDEPLYDGEMKIVEDDLNPDGSLSVDLSLYEAASSQTIYLSETSRVTAAQAVDILASLLLEKGYLPELDPLPLEFQPLVYKNGTAKVDILGIISAGGSLRVASELNVTVDTTNDLIKVIPFAVAALKGESSVTVGGNARITSGSAAQLDAYSNAVLLADAMGGATKCSFAVVVTILDTHVAVGGNAAVTAQKDVDITAKATVLADAYSTGKPAIAISVKPQSGMFASVIVIQNNTSAKIRDHASVISETGGVRVASDAFVRSNAISIAIPNSETEQSTYTTRQTNQFIAKLLGFEYNGTFGALTGYITGSGGIASALEGAITPIDPNKKSSQFMGALVVSYVSNDNTAEINTTGAVKAAGELQVLARGVTYAQQRADASLYKTPELTDFVIGGFTAEDNPKNAIGAAVGVTIFNHKNAARILRGEITAAGLLVDADMGYTASENIVKAGHTPSKPEVSFGLAGAISVHLASAENEALIGKDGSYTISGGRVHVESTGSGRYTTVGDASGKRARRSFTLGFVTIPFEPAYQAAKNSTGVGAGVAVALIGVDVSAVIEDGVDFGEGVLSEILVNASYDGTEYLEAAAGAQGGTSIVPVVAVSVGGVNTQAYLGAGKELKFAGDVNILAASEVDRTVQVDAKAVGGSVAVGGAFGVTVVNDSAEAALERSIAAKNVTVDSRSISRITQVVLASSNGATGTINQSPSTGSTNTSQVDYDKLISGGGNPTQTDNTTYKAGQADQMSASVLNMIRSLSAFMKAKNVNANSMQTVTANPPKAQTSEGSIQVAASLALNIQNNASSARIGDGVQILADGDVLVNSRIDTDSVIRANSSAVSSETAVGVGVALNKVTYSNTAYVGAERLEADSLTIRADIQEAEEKKAVEEIFSELLTYLADTEGATMLLESLYEIKGYSSLEDMLANDPAFKEQYEALPDKDPEALKEMLVQMLAAQFKEEPMDTAETLLDEFVQAVVTNFANQFQDPQFLLSLLTGGFQNKMDELLNKYALTAKVSFQRIYDMVSAALSVKFGNPGELDGVGNLISTSAISGSGAANVGVAGSAAIALVDANTSAVLAEADQISQTEDILVENGVTIFSQGAQKVYTTATAAADLKGLPEKNKDGTGNAEGKNVGVGASVAVTDLDASSEAKLGGNRNVNAGSLSVVAEIRNDIDTISVAGSDPIARRDQLPQEIPSLGGPVPNPGVATDEKDISVDASVALSMVDNLVHAIVDAGSKLQLDGGNVIQTDEELTEDVLETVNLWIKAYQRGQTYSTASGFAVGGDAAVGAAVGVNMASSDVEAAFRGDGSAKGKAKIEAITSNEDEAAGLATVVGASLDRYLDKVREVFNTVSFGESQPTLNITIMNKINSYANPAMTKLGNAAQGLPVLPMLLQALNINLPTSPTTGNSSAGEALGQASENAGGAVGQDLDDSAKKEQSFNIAAAAGANVTEHIASAVLDGTLNAESVEVHSENRANFRTLGTGAAVVPEEGSNNVAMGVAVSINGNHAFATLGGNVNAQGSGSGDGDVRVTAALTQNMDGKYRGLLGAQALAGSVSGSGGKLGFAGAVSILKAVGKGIAQINPDAVVNGGDIAVEALDQSKLAVRAGGVSAGGTAVGMGASFALIYAENVLEALVGSNARITGDDLTVSARKLSVDASDYEFPLGIQDLFTVDVTEDSKKGLINIKLAEAKNGVVGIDVAIGTDDLLKIVDMLNYLASVNYYAEAIAGSISGGEDAKAALAGSVAMLFADSLTKAEIGEGAEITLNQDASVTASSKTNGRMIGGSAAITGASTGVGVNIAAVDDRDRIYASVDASAQIRQAQNVLVKASAHRNLLNVTVAASVATGTSSGGEGGGTGTAGQSGGASLGGGINVIVTGSDVQAVIAENALVKANEAVSVVSDNLSDVTLISTSLAGSGGGTAAGGTVAVIVTENNTLANVGEGAQINGGQILVSADSEEKLLNVLASVSAAVSSGSDGSSANSVAATLGVTLTESETIAQVEDGAILAATNGAVSILANGDVKQYLVLAAASVAAGADAKTAAGATVNVNIFRHTVKALAGKNVTLVATGNAEGCDVILSATGNSEVIIVTIAGSASTGTLALNGAIPVIISDSTIETSLGENAHVEAVDSIYISSNLTNGLYDVAGGLAGARENAVGATISTSVLSNRVTTTIGSNARLIAHGKYAHTTNRKERRGVTIRANADNTILMASVSGGASGKVTVVGVVNTLVLKNAVKAQVGENVTISVGFDAEGNPVDGGDGDVSVDADDDSHLYNLAGSIGVGGNAGAGATVVVMVYDKTVQATVGVGSQIRAKGDVSVNANSKDDVYLVAVGFAASGNVGVAGNVGTLVFQNKTHAYLDGSVITARNVSVIANANSELFNIAGGLAASGNTAVTAVAVVTYFKNETIARLGNGVNIGSDGAPITGKLEVKATSYEFVTADALGLSGSGAASVGGTLDVVVTMITTQAYTGEMVSIYASGDINIEAVDNYDLIVAAMTVSASISAGVGVTALVSVGFNTISAVVGEYNILSGSDVQILAASNRDVIAIPTTVAGGGTTGAAVNIAVVVNGNKMSQDAHDAIYQSGSLNPQTQVSGSFSAAHPQAQGYQPQENLDELLAGDGQRHGEEKYDEYGQSEDADYSDGTGPKADKFDSVTGLKAESSPIDGLSDAVTAMVSAGTTIAAVDNITVRASDSVSALLITGGVSLGGSAGVGIGLSAATFFSNVQALVHDGAALNAGGNINILANAGTLSNTAALEKENALGIGDTLKGQGIDLSGNPALRLISFNVSGGSVGVGVSAAALLVFSEARALLAGDVTGAKQLTVQANMDMGNPITVVTGAAAGGVSVNVSAGTTYFSGKVESGIIGDTRITGISTIQVRSTGSTNATTAAAALALGGTAVNACTALAFNQTQVRTYIAEGVSIDAANAVIKVNTDFDATAKVFNIAVTGGAAAVYGSVAIAVNLMDAETYVGLAQNQTASTGSGAITAAHVDVSSSISSGTQILGVSVTGGSVAVNGMVALGFNRASGIAAVKQMTITAETLTVTANSDGDVTVTTGAATGGAVAVGATVAVGQLKTVNRAEVNTTGVTLDLSGGTIGIFAGTEEKPYNSESIVTVVTGSAGAVAAALNFAVALNESENVAQMIGDGGTVKADTLDIGAYGNAHAYGVLANASAAGITVNISVVYADISSIQSAAVDSGSSFAITKNLRVLSQQNWDAFGGTLDPKHPLGGCAVQKSELAQAYIFSASAGAIATASNAAIAKANAKSYAMACLRNQADQFQMTGDILVLNQANSTASANIQNLTGGVYSVGVMVGYAYADGDFQAILEVNGDLTVSGDVTVTNQYTSIADSTTNPALGGVSASLASGKVNVGYAEVTTSSQAKILGSGSITAGNFDVINTGSVKANAQVKGGRFSGSAISVVSNVVTAMLNANQEAGVEDVSLTGGNLNVLALYNVQENAPAYQEGNIKVPTAAANTGASAKVGASYGSVSLVGAAANVATASSESTVMAYVKQAGADMSGDIAVNTLAFSKADVQVDTPAASVSLANVAVAVLEANAEGSYQAYLETKAGKDISAENLTVAVGHGSEADAAIGPLGGKGVSVGAVTVSANLAKAFTQTTAKAWLSGDGNVTTRGDLLVGVNGYSAARGSVTNPGASVTISDAGANGVEAYMQTTQDAAMNVNGIVDVGSNLTVISQFNHSDSIARALSGMGSSKSSVTVNLISGAVISAEASSRLINKATIYGRGKIKAGKNVQVISRSVTKAVAEVQKGTNVTLATASATLARAKTQDTVEAGISGVALIAGEQVDVKAESDADADAKGMTGKSVTLISADAGNVAAILGTQTVQAYIGKDASVTAGGDVNVTAINLGEAIARMTEGFTFTGVAADSQILPTWSAYKTTAQIGDNAHITSTGGTITVLALDQLTADTRVDGESFGVVASLNKKYAKNEAAQNTRVSVGKAAALWAYGSILISAESVAAMNASTVAVDNSVFATAGTIQAYNTLNRTVATVVEDGAEMFSDFGAIAIRSSAGRLLSRNEGTKDSISTFVDSSRGAAVALGKANTETKYNATSDVQVGSGVSITNTFGEVDIAAYVAAYDITTKSDIGSAGLGGDTESEATMHRADTNKTTVSANVVIATGSGSQTAITGKNITVLAKLSDLDIYTYTYASTKGFLHFSEARSTIEFDATIGVQVDNAHLKAYDDLLVLADAEPDNNGPHLEAKAHTKITAFAGRVESYATVTGDADTVVQLLENAVLTGANVRVDRKNFGGSVHLHAEGTRRAIASEHEEEKNALRIKGSTFVNSKVKFHIGDAAAGIAIDIYGDGQWRSVGTAPGFSVEIFETIRIHDIRNTLPGQLTVVGLSAKLTNAIYGQKYIPELTVTNRTDKNMEFSIIDLYNESFARGTVNVLYSSDGSYNASNLNQSMDTTPEIYVESRGSGSVTFTGMVANERGSLHVEWTQSNSPEDTATARSLSANSTVLGGIIVPVIWVHQLTVVNAGNIGSQATPFGAYLAVLDKKEDAGIRVSATGDVWLELTLTEIACVDNLPSTLNQTPISGTLDLENIVTAGNLNLELPTALRMAYVANSQMAHVVIPGVIEYTTETLNLEGTTISNKELALYFAGTSDGKYQVYELPNDTILYLDSNGKVRRVVSKDGYILDTTLYSFNSNGEIVFHEYGDTRLNLSTGILTAGETGFDLYVEYKNNTWIICGSVESRQEVGVYSYTKKDGNEEYTELSYTGWKWNAVGNISYYFLSKEQYDNRGNRHYTGTYYLLKLERGYLVGVYSGKWDTLTPSFTASSTVESTTSTTTWTAEQILAGNKEQGTAVYLNLKVTQQATTNGDTTTYATPTITATITGPNNLNDTLNPADYWWSKMLSTPDMFLNAKVVWNITQNDTTNQVTSVGATIWYRPLLPMEQNVITMNVPTSDGETVQKNVYGYDLGDVRILCSECLVYSYKNTIKGSIQVIDSDGSEKKAGILHLDPGETVTLMPTSVEGIGDSVYILHNDLFVSQSGTVTYKPNNSCTFQYGVKDGTMTLIDQGRTTVYSESTQAVTLMGQQHLAKLSSELAKGSNGKYYRYKNGSWVHLPNIYAITVEGTSGTGIYDGNVLLMFIYEAEGITYHREYQNDKPYVQVGSDGSVSWYGTPEEQVKQAQAPGTNYQVSYLEGAQVKLTMRDPQGSLLDGDRLNGRPENLDILAAKGDITIYAKSKGSIGTPEDLLDMSAKGEINILNLEGQNVISTNSYVYVPAGSDGSQVDYVLEPNTEINDAEVILVTENGDIIGYDLLVTNGGKFLAMTNQNEIRENNIVTGFVPNPDATAVGDIFFHNIRVEQKSSLTFEAAGSILVKEDLDWYLEDPKNRPNWITPIGLTVRENSTVTWKAGQDISIYQGAEIAGSTVSLTAIDGTIRVDNTGAVDSSLTWTAGDDILLDSIIAKGSAIVLDAADTVTKWNGIHCGEYGSRSFIKFADTDSDSNAKLSISAGSLGTPDSWFLVDIPEAVTLHLPTVGDTYLDALALILQTAAGTDENGDTVYQDLTVGDAPILTVDKVTHPDNPKIDEFWGKVFDALGATEHDGDLLKELEKVLQDAMLGMEDPADLAAWIMERADRESWLSHLNQEAVLEILGKDEEEGLPTGFLAELLGSEGLYPLLTAEDQRQLLQTGKNLSESQISSRTDPEEVRKHLTDEKLQELFDALTEAQKQAYGLADDASTITGEEVARLLNEGKMTYSGLKDYLPEEFLARLALRDANTAEALIQTLMPDKKETIYHGIFGTDGTVAQEDPEAAADGREKAPASGAGYAMAYETAHQALTKLLTHLNEDGACFQDMGAYLGSLLTEEDIQALYDQAMEKSTTPEDDAQDPMPDTLKVHIGTSTGKTNLYNDGNIVVVQDNGSLTVDSIVSQRGSVEITVKNQDQAAGSGNVNAYYDPDSDSREAPHILGTEITIRADGSVGSEKQPLMLEQRDNDPLVISSVYEDMYLDEDYIRDLGSAQPGDKLGVLPFRKDLAVKEYVLRQNEDGDWYLDVIVRFDVIREDYPDPNPTLELTVVAENGGAYLEELTGSVSGSITACGDARYDVLDGQVGTYEKPLETQVGGTLTVNAKGDINVSETGDLILIANSENGQVNANAVATAGEAGDITLSNTNGQDLEIGVIRGDGDVTIHADGSLIPVDSHGQAACIIGRSISVDAQGTAGTEAVPLYINTGNGGTLTVNADSADIREISGDLILDKAVTGQGSLSLSAPGSILEAGETGKTYQEAVDVWKQTAEKEAKARAELADKNAEADRTAYVLEQAVAEEEKKQQAVDSLLQQLASAETESQKRKLQAALEEAREALKLSEEAVSEAEDVNQAAQEAKENALHTWEQAEQEKQAALEAFRNLVQDPTVTTAGDLNLTSGGAIGKPEHPLAVAVGGSIRAEAPDGVHIAGFGDLTVDQIQTSGSAGISATGSLADTDTGLIQAEDLVLTAGGSVGTKDNPMDLDVKELSGVAVDDFAADNAGDLVIGSIHTGDALLLIADGNVTGKDSAGSEAHTPNITAKDTTIHANGNIGTKEQPLETATEGIHGNGGQIYICNHSGELEISDTTSGSLNVDTSGNVTGSNNTTHDIIVNAGGNVGTVEDPFVFWADGSVQITGGLDVLHYLNLYRPPEAEAGRYLSPYAHCEEIFVLKVDVVADGEEKALYLLLTLDSEGNLVLLAMFLGSRETDEVFWQEVLELLRREVGVLTVEQFVFGAYPGFEEAARGAYPEAQLADLDQVSQTLKEQLDAIREQVLQTAEGLPRDCTGEALMDSCVDALKEQMEDALRRIPAENGLCAII